MAVRSNPQHVLEEQTGFAGFWKSLPEKPPTTIRIFERNDFYTVHGEDAFFISKEIYKTSTVIKYWKHKNKASIDLPYVVLSKINFDTSLRIILLVKNYRVEVYRNLSGKSNQSHWQLNYKGSPGNLTQFEDILFGGNNDMSDSACVMAIRISTDNGHNVIGVGFGDASLCSLSVCQFVDNDQFSNLESLLVQIGPKECLIQSGDQQKFDVLRQVIERSRALLTERKKADFSNKDIIQDLDRLLGMKNGEPVASGLLPEISLTHATSALSAVIRYLELLNNETHFHQFTLGTFDLSLYMKLDPSAVSALNLLPTPSDGNNRSSSLYGVLNRCRTAAGQRLLAQWMKQPLVDKNKIEERLSLVEGLFDDTELRQYLQEDFLKKVPDYQRMSKKFLKKKSTLQDCYKVYQSVEQLPSLMRALYKYDGSHTALFGDVFIQPLQELCNDFTNFQQMIESTLDLSQVENHEFLIKPSFDRNLAELREKLDSMELKIQNVLNKAAKDLSLDKGKSIKLEHVSHLGYFFRVTCKDEKAIRNNKKYTVIDAQRNGVRFRNNSLTNLNDEYIHIKEQYTDTQKAIVTEIINIASGYSEPMMNLNNVISQLDVLTSFATAAASAPGVYVRPSITEKGVGSIILKNARHPCLEMQDDVAYISNDVVLERGKQEFLIVTGPNMGGKSTYIRSVGIVVLMTHIGSFVPCETAEVCVVDSILARVGAGDCVQRGVSTFMAEMLETAQILRTASECSLIIIDELGRGTSTYDGFGLAWAIAYEIAMGIKAMCVFATHFHELTSLADYVQSVVNLHVTALTADKSLTMLYKVKPGVCDQSFGIHVAELVKFPNRVLKFARQKATELEDYHVSGGGDEREESTDVTRAKRLRLEKQDGEKLIQEYLKKFQQISSSGDKNKMRGELKQFKNDLKSEENNYIQSLINKIC